MVEKSNRYETFRIIKFRILFSSPRILIPRDQNCEERRSKLLVQASFSFYPNYPLDFPFLDPKFPRNGSVTRRANNGRIYARSGEGKEWEDKGGRGNGGNGD